MTNKDQTSIESKLLIEVSKCRSVVLDIIELELGNEPNWRILRSKILKAFGERGLSGKVIETLSLSH